jgi:hypothetical protein
VSKTSRGPFLNVYTQVPVGYIPIDFGRAENRFCRAKALMEEESPNTEGRDAV